MRFDMMALGDAPGIVTEVAAQCKAARRSDPEASALLAAISDYTAKRIREAGGTVGVQVDVVIQVTPFDEPIGGDVASEEDDEAA